jgi:hypothetical protein
MAYFAERRYRNLMGISVSPILESAIESLEHGIEHYFAKDGKSNKFVFLHIDQAIELLMKAKLQSIPKQSIYYKSGKTIDFFECIGRLEKNGISIPEKSHIEEIHDYRNLAQHKGVSFEEKIVGFFVEKSYIFAKDFLKNEMGLNIKDLIPGKTINFLETLSVSESRTISDEQFEIAEDLFNNHYFFQSVLSSGASLEFLIDEYASNKNLSSWSEIIRELGKDKKLKLSKEDINNIKEIHNLRNVVVHTDKVPTKKDAERALKIVDGLRKDKMVIPKKLIETNIETPGEVVIRETDDPGAPLFRVERKVTTLQEALNAQVDIWKLSQTLIDRDLLLDLYENRKEIDFSVAQELLIRSSIQSDCPLWYWTSGDENLIIGTKELVDICEDIIKTGEHYPSLAATRAIFVIGNKRCKKLLKVISKEARQLQVRELADEFFEVLEDKIKPKKYLTGDLKPLNKLIKTEDLDIRSKGKRIKIILSGKKYSVSKALTFSNGLDLLIEEYYNSDRVKKGAIIRGIKNLFDERLIPICINGVKSSPKVAGTRWLLLQLDMKLYCRYMK